MRSGAQSPSAAPRSRRHRGGRLRPFPRCASVTSAEYSEAVVRLLAPVDPLRFSTKYDDVPVDLMDFIGAVTSGDVDRAQAMAPYSLRDMASDGIASAAGARHRPCARGGFLDGRHDRAEDGGRVSRPGVVADLDDVHDRGAGVRPVHPEAQQVLFSPRPADREGYVAAAERELVWASRKYGDPATLRALAAASYDRSYYPAGVPRQLAAMILDGSRADALRALDVPTLVIHGLDDTLIDPSGGERTAELVPGARLVLVEDMGHDRPRALWPQLVNAIHEHTERVTQVPGRGVWVTRRDRGAAGSRYEPARAARPAQRSQAARG